ncbi:MAG: D-2-hydroxyacid dehydrogenase [Microcoleus sp.]
MNIVFLDWLTMGLDISHTELATLGNFEVYLTTNSDQRYERIKDADIVITKKVILDQPLLEKCPKLRLICLANTGMNNIDLQYTKERGISVINVADYCTEIVAQHTFAMLFWLLENLEYYNSYVKSGSYIQSPIHTHLDRTFWELSGKRWGVIGLGNIGKQVATIAKAFGCEVVYFSTSGLNNNVDYQKLSLSELLLTSDIISIHASLNEKTMNLLNYDRLKMMKSSAYLINVARGNIVNEAALVKALNENRLAGAGLDVLSVEPLKSDNPLLAINNKEKLLITPHIAWASIEARNRLVKRVAQNIRNFLKDD